MSEREARVTRAAQVVWDYHLMRQPLARSDCLLVLCSNDTRVAEYGAHLYLEGWAPLLVFSGDRGKLTEGLYDAPEAEHFAAIARDLGVPDSALVLETQATNTGENIANTRALLAARTLTPASVTLVQKPHMERRAWATFRKVWPQPRVRVTSPPLAFADYPNTQLPRDLVISIMVGDLYRIRLYGEKGFQIPQPIPDPVQAAYDELVALGYTDHINV